LRLTKFEDSVLDIIFRQKKFAKICNNHTQLVRTFGDRMARRIRQRLDEFQAAANLAEIRTLPGPRCHELTGDRKGQFSVDLVHPYRLLFVPANDPLPEKDDGGLDWTRITAIEIIEVEDTHG
jgi:proteic killer suppression protein